jgi:aspartyl-tRNA synthetase
LHTFSSKKTEPQSPLLEIFREMDFLEKLQEATGVRAPAMLSSSARTPSASSAQVLSKIRAAKAAKRFDLIDTSVHSLFWVTDFPLFEET